MNFIIFCLMILIMVCTLVFCDFFPSSSEVDEAMVKGIIKDRKHRWSKKCRIFTKIKRCQRRILELRRQIKACQVEYAELECNYEKENY